MKHSTGTAKLISIFLALTMILGILPGNAAAQDKSSLENRQIHYTADSAEIDISLQMESFGFNPFRLRQTVDADLSEQGSLSDKFNGTAVTPLDALSAALMHIKGDNNFSNHITLDADGSLSSIMGAPVSGFLYFVNGEVPGDGQYIDDGFGGSYQTVYDATEMCLEDGDSISFVILQDQAGLTDYYTWFEHSGTKVQTLTVKPGEEFELVLKGFQALPYILGDQQTQNSLAMPTPLVDIELTLVDSSTVPGAGIFESLNEKTDASGKAALKFDNEGEYFISAAGTAGAFPIISPILHVTVENSITAPVEEKAALKELVKKLEDKALSKADFTAESWDSYQDALENAKALLSSEDATAEDLIDAKESLERAFDDLEHADTRTYIDVPRGASIGVFKKGNNYAPYQSYSVTKSDTLSSFGRDVYWAELPLNTDLHIEAYVPKTTAKQVRMINLKDSGTSIKMTPMPLDSWTGSDSEDASYMYTNADSSGCINIRSGEFFLLDAFRIPQAEGSGSGDYFVEPEYTYELMGESIDIAPAGAPGREQLRITGMRFGISAIKIMYNPIEYIAQDGSSILLSGSDNAHIVLVNVGASDSGFDTGITVNSDFDTYYFSGDKGNFSFHPAAGTSVRVLEPDESWSTGWKDYTAESDGSFNVALKSGCNIIELKNGASPLCYYVLRAKGIDVTVENASHPNADFAGGDKAVITLKGIDAPVGKMAGIYSPLSADKSFIRYTDGINNFDSSPSPASEPSEFTVEYVLNDTSANTLRGQICMGIKGELGSHRDIDALGIDRSSAPSGASSFAWFGVLPEIQLPIAGSPVLTDKSQLERAIAQAELLNPADYTSETWSAVNAALESAQLILEKDDATQDEADIAAFALTDAIDKLMPVPESSLPDKTKLGETIYLAGTLKKADYTSASWEIMQAALAAAEIIYENKHAEQIEINAAEAVLADLISKLEAVVAIPDKTILTETIQSVKALNPADYTVESWAALQPVLAAAELVHQDPGASQAQTDNAAALLSDALKALVKAAPGSAADKSILNAMITVAKNLKSDNYTAETWAVLEAALLNAQAVYDKADASQAEADQAKTELSRAVSELVPLPGEGVDKSILSLMIAAASQLKSSAYTPETWTALEAALADARRISEADDVVQLMVDAASTALSDAIKALVPIAESGVDKSRLYEFIQKAETYNSSNYTTASWRVMQEVLTQAKAVYGNINATQTEVSAIALTLSDKIDALVRSNNGGSIGIGNGGGGSSSGGSTPSPKPTETPKPEAPSNTDNPEGTPSGSDGSDDSDDTGNSGAAPVESPDASGENPFTDILEDEWYYDFVIKAYSSGLMKGVVDTEFLPEGTFSRAMLVTMLYRYDKMPAVAGNVVFADVLQDEWYTDAIKWASALELVQGYGDGLFGTNDPVTREQFVTILYKYAQVKGFDVKKTASLSAFTDSSAVSDWAHDAISWALGEELIYGRDDTTLAPEGSSTRAEAATLIVRFIEKFQ